MSTTYLDHAATTPMLPEAYAALVEHAARPGNASALHSAGRDARRVVEESRERIAAHLRVRPTDVVLTGGGTEADNLALLGLARARRASDPRRTRLLTSAVEHPAVLEPLDWLAAHEGFTVERLPVDADGVLDVAAAHAALVRDPASVALVSVMSVNNEVGTRQPLAAVAETAREHGVPLHSDAVQAYAHLPVGLDHADAISLSAHKIGGPQGVGALVVRRELDLVVHQHGGGQERDLRSGTLPTALVAAFAAAAEHVHRHRDAERDRLEGLRRRLVDGLAVGVPTAVVNGPADPDRRSPHVTHVTLPGCEGDALLMLLDAHGIQCSTGAACSAGVPQPSHVLRAMGRDDADARAGLRFSLGHDSTADDVDRLLEVLPEAVARASAAARTRVPRRSWSA